MCKRTRLALMAAIITPIVVLISQVVVECVNWADNPIVLYFYWIPLCCVPIPVAVIIWGIHLKAKGQAWELTMWLGVVSTVCLCVIFYMGMFRYQEVRDYYHNQEDTIQGEAFIQKVEPILDMDVPAWDALNVWDYDGIPRGGRNQNFTCYRFWLDREAARSLEAQLAEDERWEQNVRNELLGIQPGLWEHDWEDGQFALFYNMDLQVFNQVPAEDGVYRCLYVSYDQDQKCLRFVEYDLVYLK